MRRPGRRRRADAQLALAIAFGVLVVGVVAAALATGTATFERAHAPWRGVVMLVVIGAIAVAARRRRA